MNINKSKLVFWQFLVLILLIPLISHTGCNTVSEKRHFAGCFIANDCGESHGGFEWVGEYTADLEIIDNEGNFNLSLSSGFSDPLCKHQFEVTNFVEVGGRLSFNIEGRQAVLIIVEIDKIWDGKYSGYYCANKSINSSEQIGLLPLDAFSGLDWRHYLDLRLRPL